MGAIQFQRTVYSVQCRVFFFTVFFSLYDWMLLAQYWRAVYSVTALIAGHSALLWVIATCPLPCVQWFVRNGQVLVLCIVWVPYCVLCSVKNAVHSV